MLRHILLFCLVALAASGCTFKKLAYRHADLIAYYEANGAFDLNSDQKKQVRPAIDETLEWIRQDPLPLVVEDLERFRNDMENSLSEEEVDRFIKTFDERRKYVLSRVVKMGVPTLVTLSKDQIDHLGEEMQEGNEDLQDLVASKGEDFTKRAKKMADKNVEFYEEFLDDVSDEQEKLIRDAMTFTPETAAMALQARKESQQSFLDLVRQEKDPAKLEATLLSWVEKPEQMGSPVVRENRERRQKAHRDLVLAIDKTLTTKQREHARKTWAEHIESLREEIRPK